ncbi:hypothetical protein MGG_02926 [Pyricularia oryzae 70-15]|uniref:Uncharacterized protein n=3 Tax=Pyricularia oryzae TaxID=318829 RepID=G5EI66_PYRO7|nr:uncharacterized protein MGG_02926 [Pyricularia oryzae 70-15]EAQ71283.1 hypothetical protein MGCH7_ch7g690 [Pyricularia oryzae 70-15]EHA46048.1 hypothetical protein MGG_02926 [Pyricularia oryzae 70-15]ELQ40180.1 hypothetical protein OOU_Y34scaffold00458g8 [Pyricularia oryzae Y34]
MASGLPCSAGRQLCVFLSCSLLSGSRPEPTARDLSSIALISASTTLFGHGAQASDGALVLPWCRLGNPGNSRDLEQQDSNHSWASLGNPQGADSHWILIPLEHILLGFLCIYMEGARLLSRSYMRTTGSSSGSMATLQVRPVTWDLDTSLGSATLDPQNKFTDHGLQSPECTPNGHLPEEAMACLEWTTQMSLFFFESEKTPMQIPWAIPAFTASLSAAIAQWYWKIRYTIRPNVETCTRVFTSA